MQIKIIMWLVCLVWWSNTNAAILPTPTKTYPKLVASKHSKTKVYRRGAAVAVTYESPTGEPQKIKGYLTQIDKQTITVSGVGAQKTNMVSIPIASIVSISTLQRKRKISKVKTIGFFGLSVAAIILLMANPTVLIVVAFFTAVIGLVVSFFEFWYWVLRQALSKKSTDKGWAFSVQ